MQKGYVGYSLNEEIRSTSTSGGICQTISRYFLLNGGVVSAVHFDENFNVIRGFAYTLDELKKMNKSKYVQANQGQSFRKIRELLENNFQVLFIGTPCQVGGLKSYLHKEYKNLYCIDFVCLGVPSKKVWNIYKAEEFGDKKITALDFKNKQNGWRNFTFHAEFKNGDEHNEVGRQNPYMNMMISKIDCRPSCYTCTFRNIKRVSDITVADAWGTEKIAAELLDDKGTSSIMVNSEKGKMLLDLVSKECVLKEVEIKDLWDSNTNARRQFQTPNERQNFYEDLDRYGFKGAYRRAWYKIHINGKLKFIVSKFKTGVNDSGGCR